MAALLRRGSAGVSKGLFKQQKKNDPEFLASQEKLKSSLINGLSRAIKELQLLFANKEEEGGGTIEDCRATQQLCAKFEDILRHGLKAKWFGQNTSFWPVVLKVSRKQAIEYINSLQHAQSDSGRCRAWIRLAVNECSLESYINVLCQDTSLLGSYYETYSFLRDAEMVSPLTQLLTGLSQLNINMTVDTASLEFEAVPEAFNRTMPALRLKTAADDKLPNKVASKSKSRKRNKHPTASQDADAVELEDDSSVSGHSGSEGTGSLAQSWSELGSTDALDIEPADDRELPTPVATRSQVLGEPQEEEIQIFYEEFKFFNEQDMIGNTGELQVQGDTLLEWQFENELGLDTNHESGSTSEVAPLNDGEQALTIDTAKTTDPTPGSTHREHYITSLPETITIDDTLIHHEIDDMDKTPMQTSTTNPFQMQFEQELEAAQDNKQGSPRNEKDIETLLSLSTLTSSTGNTNNPFLEYEEENDEDGEKQEDDHEPPVSTVLFSDVESISNQVLPLTSSEVNPFASPPPLSPTNPFLDEVETASQSSSKNGSQSSSKNGSTLDQQATNPFDDVRTPDSISPTAMFYSNEARGASRNSSPASSQRLSSTHSSKQTSPLHSPVLSPPDREGPVVVPSGPPSDDLSSCASSTSFDLSMMLESTQFTSQAHLQPKDDHFEAEMNVSQLQTTINDIKTKLRSPNGEEEMKQALRKKVVILQLRLQKLKELSEEAQMGLDPMSCQEVLGHMFVCQPWQTKILTNVTCEGCGRKIRGLVRRWYRCKGCQVCCHKGCLSAINHMCSANKIKELEEEVKYVLEVCPERGLTKQQFRCANCSQAFNATSTVARLCDYSGCYYCPSCHHNDVAIIPARVMHNWDFNLRKVCCRCADLLNCLYSRPLLRVQQVNPLLYTYVQDLVTVEVLRKDVLMMKQYFLKCQTAKDNHLLKLLDPFPHFKDSSKLFSLSDFVAVSNGKLLPQLAEIHREFTMHIKQECRVCFKRGTLCKFCGSDEVLFPFDRHVSLCPHCMKVYHKTCYSEMTTCPVCSRTRRIK